MDTRIKPAYDSQYVGAALHPNPLRASFARLDPAKERGEGAGRNPVMTLLRLTGRAATGTVAFDSRPTSQISA
jgi:hypothetical protein